MIYKHEDYKNGYVLAPSSTNEDFQSILSEYDKVRCIICNANTAKNFNKPLLGDNIITINNNISDGCFFINGTY